MTVLCSMVALAAPAEAQDQSNKWTAGNWFGSTNQDGGSFSSCAATYSDFSGENSAFTVNRLRRGTPFIDASGNFADRNPSAVYVTYNDDESDDRGFDWLKGKIVAVSIGAFRAQARISGAWTHSFEFETPLSIVDTLAAGGTFVVQLPNGKRYVNKLPAGDSGAAMTRFRSCLAENANSL